MTNENMNSTTNTAAEGTRLVFFSGQRIPVPADLSIEQIKAGLAGMFPRIADAIAHEDESGNVRFYVEAGEKGSDTDDSESAPASAPADGTRLVFFSGQRIPVPADLTIDQIKAGLAGMFPRIADAIAHEDESGNVRFYVEAGEKGSDDSEPTPDPTPAPADGTRLVFFSGQRIPVPADLTIDQIKAGLAGMFPRIADAIAHEDESGNVRFYVEAGEKGSDDSEPTPDPTPAPADGTRLVFFSGQRIPVPADLSIEQIKAGLAGMFPRIADAIAHEDESGNVRFYVEAGEKGSSII